MAKRLSPAEWATIAILSVATAVIGVRLPGRPLLLPAFALHASMLAGFATFAAMASASRLPVLRAMRPLAVVLVMFTLYLTLGVGGFRVMPWTGDALLWRVD